MGKMTNAELDEIVKWSLPGYKVSRRSQVAGEEQDAAYAGRTDTDTSGGDANHLEELRRKYLGADFADEYDDPFDESLVTDFENSPRANPADDDADDEMIVSVEPVTSGDPLDRGSRAKVAVISKKKKVIGQQG